MALDITQENALAYIFDIIDKMLGHVYVFAQAIIGFCTMPISEALGSLIDWLDNLVDIPILSDVIFAFLREFINAMFPNDITLFGFFFSGAIIIYLAFIFVRWILSIIP